MLPEHVTVPSDAAFATNIVTIVGDERPFLSLTVYDVQPRGISCYP
jgi:hypothetical protein